MKSTVTQRRYSAVAKRISLLAAAAALATMGVLTALYPNNETAISGKSQLGVPEPTVTSKVGPTLKTPFATPAVSAVPCPKRATLPC
jgi:hypothetical protein